MKGKTMPRIILAALVVAALLASPAAAHTIATPNVRFGNHPTYVRAVVDYSGGGLRTSNLTVLDSWLYNGYSSALMMDSQLQYANLQHPDLGLTRVLRSGYGLNVRLVQTFGSSRVPGVLMELRNGTHKFGRVSYFIVTGNRLVADAKKR